MRGSPEWEKEEGTQQLYFWPAACSSAQVKERRRYKYSSEGEQGELVNSSRLNQQGGL